MRSQGRQTRGTTQTTPRTRGTAAAETGASGRGLRPDPGEGCACAERGFSRLQHRDSMRWQPWVPCAPSRRLPLQTSTALARRRARAGRPLVDKRCAPPAPVRWRWRPANGGTRVGRGSQSVQSRRSSGDGDSRAADVDGGARARGLTGRGVDGDITRAGGMALARARRELAFTKEPGGKGLTRCPVGDARITVSGNPGVPWCIHAVSLTYSEGTSTDEASLKDGDSTIRSADRSAMWHAAEKRPG